MIDEAVVNDPMMWLTGGSAWMEEVMEMGVMIGMVVEGIPHI